MVCQFLGHPVYKDLQHTCCLYTSVLFVILSMTYVVYAVRLKPVFVPCAITTAALSTTANASVIMQHYL